MIRTQFANRIVEHIRSHIAHNLPAGVELKHHTFTAADTSCKIQSGIFGLRYNVMVRSKGTKSPFPPTHRCIHDEQFHDETDFASNTTHTTVWRDGKIVAAMRAVDASGPLELERYDWYKLRAKHPHIGDSFMEPARVVGCKSIRGSALVPLMYVDTCLQVTDHSFDRMFGVVEHRSLKLLSHYKKWVRYKVITDEPFETPEFVPGNKTHIIEVESSKESPFIFANMLPAYLGYRALAARDAMHRTTRRASDWAVRSGD